jgi:hypothetical protein
MTRSIFDPDGGETERSGSRNLGPDAANISHVPPDVVDGNVQEEPAGGSDNPDLEQISKAAYEERGRRRGSVERAE